MAGGMRELSQAAFARLHDVAPRQVRRWIKAGLPITTDTPAKVRVKPAEAWLSAQAAGRGRSGREIDEVLTSRSDELLRQLNALVDSHLPSAVVGSAWAAQVHAISARLRGWPTQAAPGLVARLHGEVTDPPADPRLTAASVALLTRAPASAIAVALATAEAARVCLDALAGTPIAIDPQRERLIAAARARAVVGLADVTTPRARVAAVRARLEAFRREIRRGDWERSERVEARWAAATTAARQMLLESAPRLVMQVSQPATAPTMTLALATAVETALYALTRGGRDPADVKEI